MEFEPIPAEDEHIAKEVIGAAIEVHRILGPGFIEGVYQRALRYELELRSFEVDYEQKIFVPYKDIQIAGQRLDLRVGCRVIVDA